MLATNPQKISMILNTLSAEKLREFVEDLKPVIGKAGDRRFKCSLRTKNSTLQDTIYLNDVVKRLNTIWEDLKENTTASNRESIEAVFKTVTKIYDKNKEADVILRKSNILIRIFSAIRSFFENISFNQNKILRSIENAARKNLIILNSQAEILISIVDESNKSQIKKKEANSAEREAKVKAIRSALTETQIDYLKTKQMINNSEDDILCEIIQQTIDDGKCFTLLATINPEKFDSVFKAAAQKARDSNNYQLFALLFSRSTLCSGNANIIDVVKLATCNGSADKIKILREEVNKHINVDFLRSIIDQFLNDAQQT